MNDFFLYNWHSLAPFYFRLTVVVLLHWSIYSLTIVVILQWSMFCMNRCMVLHLSRAVVCSMSNICCDSLCSIRISACLIRNQMTVLLVSPWIDRLKLGLVPIALGMWLNMVYLRWCLNPWIIDLSRLAVAPSILTLRLISLLAIA